MVLPLTTRWALAILLSIGLQLCCCNFKTLLGGCCHIHHGSSHNPVALDDAVRLADGEHHRACCHHPDSTSRSSDGDLPSAPNGGPESPCDQQRGCSCGTHDKAPHVVAKTCLDIAPALTAILTPLSILPPRLALGMARYTGLHAVLLPQTSLLQQHCALIV
jgi:hypothetical protein